MSVHPSGGCGMSPGMATKTCSISDCGRDVYAKALCAAHYRRQLRDPDADLSRPVREDRGELHDVSTRVTAETLAALEGHPEGRYAVSAAILEAWANGTPLPKRQRRRTAA